LRRKANTFLFKITSLFRRINHISSKLEFLQEENVATFSKAVEVEEEDVSMAIGIIARAAEEAVDVEEAEVEIEDQEVGTLLTTVLLHLVLLQHLNKSNMSMKEVLILPILQMRTSILTIRESR